MKVLHKSIILLNLFFRWVHLKDKPARRKFQKLSYSHAIISSIVFSQRMFKTTWHFSCIKPAIILQDLSRLIFFSYFLLHLCHGLLKNTVRNSWIRLSIAMVFSSGISSQKFWIPPEKKTDCSRDYGYSSPDSSKYGNPLLLSTY